MAYWRNSLAKVSISVSTAYGIVGDAAIDDGTIKEEAVL